MFRTSSETPAPRLPARRESTDVSDGAKLCPIMVNTADSLVQVTGALTDSGSPLSYQERAWLGGEQRLGVRPVSGKSGTYNILVPLYLSGVLDVDAMEAALTAIVRRHENLRTRISAADAQPQRFVGLGDRVTLRVVDLSAHPEASRVDEAPPPLGRGRRRG